MRLGLKKTILLGAFALCACGEAALYEPSLSRPPESISMFQDDVAACRRWAEPAPGRPGSFEDRVDGCMKNKGYAVED